MDHVYSYGPGCFTVFEVAQDSVAEHQLEVIPVIALRKDVVAYSAGRVAAIGRVADFEDYLSVWHYGAPVFSVHPGSSPLAPMPLRVLV